jgi:hypothetical protein
MKRIMFLVVALMLVAVVSEATESQMFYTVTLENTTAAYRQEQVPATTIRPDVDKILGYTIQRVTDNTANSELVVGVYDSDATNLSGKEVIGESETIDETVGGKWFPRPRPIAEAITVRQGANTVVEIYFIRE